MSYLGRTAVVAVACLALCGRAAAVAPEIKDEGKFFSPEALKKANEQIRELYRKYDRDLLIETYPSVPADKKDKIKEMSKQDRDKFFLEWAKSRADAAVVRGVYILICKEPGRIEVYRTQKGGSFLDAASRNKLIKSMTEEFGDKEYDKGLMAGIKFVQEKMAAANK
jgi:uncharacterized membrane protein YgcG